MSLQAQDASAAAGPLRFSQLLANQHAWMHSLDGVLGLKEGDAKITTLSLQQFTKLRTLILGDEALCATMTIDQFKSAIPTRHVKRKTKEIWRGCLLQPCTWYKMLTSTSQPNRAGNAASWWDAIHSYLSRGRSFDDAASPCLPLSRLLYLVREWKLPLAPLCQALCSILREQVADACYLTLKDINLHADHSMDPYRASRCLPRETVTAVLTHLLREADMDKQGDLGPGKDTARGTPIGQELLAMHWRLELLLQSKLTSPPRVPGKPDQDRALFMSAEIRALFSTVQKERMMLSSALIHDIVDVRVSALKDTWDQRFEKAEALFRLKVCSDEKKEAFAIKWEKKRAEGMEIRNITRSDRQRVANATVAAVEAASQPTADQHRCFAHLIQPRERLRFCGDAPRTKKRPAPAAAAESKQFAAAAAQSRAYDSADEELASVASNNSNPDESSTSVAEWPERSEKRQRYDDYTIF